MNVTYLIHFDVKEEQRHRFLRLLDPVLDAMRHEDSFVSATLHKAPGDPTRFMLHETWVDHQEVIDVQLQRPYRRAWHDALPELLATPREIAVWIPLRTDA